MVTVGATGSDIAGYLGEWGPLLIIGPVVGLVVVVLFGRR